MIFWISQGKVATVYR